MTSGVRRFGRIAVSIGVIAAVTTIYSAYLRVNPTTVALTYVVVVTLVATGWGATEAMAASLVAVGCFNYLFLPPLLTFTIADPQNWVALAAFTLTAIVVGQLSARFRQRQVESIARQHDLERLYAVSRVLLLSEGGPNLTPVVARQIAEMFNLRAAAVYDRRRDVVSWGGPAELPDADARLRDVARRGVTSTAPDGVMIAPIQLGGHPIGSVLLAGEDVSDTVLQSIANLVAIALERVQNREVTALADAARASSELRTTVLDALAHGFKTPLTSMKAAAGSLRTSEALGARDRELATIVDEDVGRLQALVADAISMLRIDSGDFAVRPHLVRVADVVDAALSRFDRELEEHRIVKDVPHELLVNADRDLLVLALTQLVDNALKYSPPTSTIEISAGSNGTTTVAVRNSGAPIPEREQSRIFERFYRGERAVRMPGTGLGLAIVLRIATAHGGTVDLSTSADAGTAFTISLPASRPEPLP